MSELYAKLLDAMPPPRSARGHGPGVRAAAAVRAVLKLHEPEPCGWPACRDPDAHRVCTECGRVVNHPCPTIRAIARALEVDGG